MKTKTSAGLLVLLVLGIVLLVLGIAAWRLTRVRRADRAEPVPAAPAPVATRPAAAPPRPARPARPPAIEISDVDVIDGRVLDAATYEGVPDAKLVFRGAGGDATFTTSSDGTFELTPPATGERALVTVTAPGYRPYLPVRAGTWLTLARGAAAHGVVLYLEAVAPDPRRAPPFDATITGHVRDPAGAPIAGAVVRAAPSIRVPVATVSATTGADGAFTLAAVDHGAYDVSAEADGRVRIARDNVLGGSRNVELVLDAGLPLAGQVVDAGGAPVTAFTLTVQRHAGLERRAVTARSLIDPRGRFAVRVPRGDYELMASAGGHAPSAPIQAAAGAADLRIVLGNGATLRGKVIASDDQTSIGNASVEVERATRRVGAGATGVRAVTRADGSFELSGVPVGPLSLGIHADGYHTRIESGPTAREGAVLGPITIALNRIGAGEPAGFERIGIGIGFGADGDALQISWVLPGTSASDAGVQAGDRLLAIDGVPVEALGLDGAFVAIGGQLGTTVTLTLQRDGQLVQLAVERRLLRT